MNTISTLNPIKKIDSHQHFWQLSRGDYRWLSEDLTVLYQDYLPERLTTTLAINDIANTIVVQAADSHDETRFLLKLAKSHSFIAGVVGWVDFTDTNALRQLNFFASDPYFKGVRPMLQDIEQIDWILNPKFTPIFQFLAAHKLCFDALVHECHLPHVLTIAKQHPHLNIVINHLAKPDLTKPKSEHWEDMLYQLACLKNVSIKFSGLMSQAQADCVDIDTYRPYFELIYQLFGANRILWGSDWPVVNMNGCYTDWHYISDVLISVLPVSEQRKIWSDNAKRLYRLF